MGPAHGTAMGDDGLLAAGGKAPIQDDLGASWAEHAYMVPSWTTQVKEFIIIIHHDDLATGRVGMRFQDTPMDISRAIRIDIIRC